MSFELHELTPALSLPETAMPLGQLHGDLRGHVAVVLGGTGVLGTAVIRALYQHGARVVVVSRSAEKTSTLASVLSDTAPLLNDDSTGVYGCIASNGDVTSEDALNELSRAVLTHSGAITALLCLVGGNNPATTVMPDGDPLSIPYDEFRHTLDLNLRDGFYNPVRVIGPYMLEKLDEHSKSLSIVATSSMAALTPLSRVGAYGAAKAAMANYATWLAGELGRRYGSRVRVNSVTPGFVVAEQNRRLLLNDDGTPTDRGRQILEHTPFRRFGEAGEIAPLFVSLLSDSTSFVTGQQIVVDGGFSSTTI